MSSPMNAPHCQEVVLGAVVDERGRYLLSLRSGNRVGADYWELPGGKIEDGETAEQALVREVCEEINLTVDDFHFVCTTTPAQAIQPVRLHLYRITRWSGKLHHNLGQEILWCTPKQIRSLRILPSSLPLLDCLACPPLLCITPPVPEKDVGSALFAHALTRVDELQRCGEKAMLLWRQPEWSMASIEQAVAHLLPECRSRQIPFALAYHADLAQKYHTDFIHYSATQFRARPANISVPCGSAYHELTDIQSDLTPTYALISPVKTTRSKPQATPLGWPKFSELATRSEAVNYALGGMRVQDLSSARQAGAYGIAGIEYWW